MLSKKRRRWLFAVLLIPAVALIMSTAATEVWADDPVCWFNIEFNATDLDVGPRGFFDYEPWWKLTIDDPDDYRIARIRALESMEEQGFAEEFFEGGEPTLFEQSFGDFFNLFPRGPYRFRAQTIEEDVVTCRERLSYVIPCAPEISASGNRGLGVTISWDPVTEVVDTEATDENVAAVIEEPEDFDAEDFLECKESERLEIIGYEVIVETEVDGKEKQFKIDLPGDATSVHVPPEFIDLSDEFEFEVLAIERSGNQTISEDEFCVNEKNGHVIECPDEGEE